MIAGSESTTVQQPHNSQLHLPLALIIVDHYHYEAQSLLVILFLLLLNLAIALCMCGNITAVCIRLLRRLPLLGIAWRVFSFSHWASEPHRRTITQACGLNITGCVSNTTPCSSLFTITIYDSFKLPGYFSWTYIVVVGTLPQLQDQASLPCSSVIYFAFFFLLQ